MPRIRTMGRFAALLFGLAATFLAAAAVPAFAAQVPPSVAGWGTTASETTSVRPQLMYTVSAAGMPGWQIALIAIGAAAAAAVLAVFLDRARAARRAAAPST